jgi:hypothetical protein
MIITVYKIWNKDRPGMLYVGSCKNFKHRKNEHKSSCCNPKSKKYNCTGYKYIRENGGWDEWSIDVIWVFEVADKTEQRMIEQFFIKTLNAPLNDRKAYTSPEQAKQRDKQQIKAYRKANIDRFKCEPCGYSTCEKTKLTRHEATNKHKRNLNLITV